ncbi:MAG: ABC transporter permease [Promethearchaeota archaeon]
MTKIKLVFNYAFRDLFKQKSRTALGIIGVAISVGLLAIVLFLSDSISGSFIDYLSTDAGDQDAVISIRHYNGEPDDRSSYFQYKPIIEIIQINNSEEIKDYIPRMEVSGKVNVSEGFNTKKLTNFQESVKISGIDFDLENDLDFGSFKDPDTDQLLSLKELPLRHCAIYYAFNDLIKYSEGDSIRIEMQITHGEKTINKTQYLIIDEVFDYDLKWPNSYRNRNLIIVDIETLYTIFGTKEFEGRCNKLILTFTEENILYDIRDTAGTEKKVKNLAAGIQLDLGINEYEIDLPKLDVLGYSEFLSLGITIIFVFVSIVSSLISGILINGILKTSVEERIREFGIFRTLGGYKNHNLAIVLVQGFLLCNFGTLSGIIGGYYITQYLMLPFAENFILSGFGMGQGSIALSLNITSLLISYCMGIGVGLIVSISPAIKVRQLQLIEAIHPYRHEDTLYHLQKKASVNYKLIIVGLILAGNGLFIYMVIPRLLISMDMSLFAGVLITILLVFLIGMTLAGLGLIPLVIRIMIELFRPASKKLYHVIKIFVFRYQRRNSSTVMIFAMSFSFVIFTSTVIQTLSSQFAVTTYLRYGSDLVIETKGWDTSVGTSSGGGMFGGGGGGGFFSTSFNTNNLETTDSLKIQSNEYSIDPSRIMTTDFKEELLSIDGIEKVSSVLASPSQLTQIYSEVGKEFSAEMGDYAGLSTQSISLYGIDEEYSSTVDIKYMKFAQGEMDEVFNQLFINQSEYNCIISEGIAVALNLNLGDKVRITIQRGDESENFPFTIIGTASSMPGFAGRFGSSQASANRGGVLISQNKYIELLDIPKLPYIDKMFIKLTESKLSVASDVENEIEDNYEYYYDYNLINLERSVISQQKMFAVIDAVFMLILSATIVICLFGLLSSSYSTIIERTKEIGIIRTLGLKGKDINRMFVIESLIIMLSSGTVGVIVGWGTSWLLSGSLNLMTDSPVGTVFPWTNFITIYVISILFILIGMTFLLRKIRKKKIVDIYRESM